MTILSPANLYGPGNSFKFRRRVSYRKSRGRSKPDATSASVVGSNWQGFYILIW